ncbi:signal transduction histidine kinase [Stackebrandtia albiflava]|uniref:Oxygen sensor histidine kinase NreB n=1 Tax=Stackebrandtia albiflava TaxID=406432 RepID=A0A562UL54_9ACTN|nr:sensor histidine kinase [Stackebrandtia albiflava]TWJ06336.1 signal transduction histidine kinase [Stackebrandtia albiflava]
MTERVWLDRAMHAGFLLLVVASAARLVTRHGWATETVPLVICGVMTVAYLVGIVAGTDSRAVVGWLAAILVLWLVLVLVAPSFAWCAVPLYFLCLRHLPPPVTVAVTVVLTGAVVVGQVRIADVVDPSLILAPIGIAAMVTVVFWTLEHELTARRRLIGDLVATRDSLAESQRRAGTLAERERLAGEIHDTLAQGLASIGMLLQAAERSWEAEPVKARSHVTRAAAVAAHDLAEARRFLDDLTPEPDGTVAGDLRRLVDGFRSDDGADVRFHCAGDPRPVPAEARGALSRVARQAVANALEHSGGGTVVVTLSFLEEEIRLDVVDDGAGMRAPGVIAPGRGFGMRSMRDRLARLGGSLEVESRPGEGTAIAARIPFAGSGG